MDNVVNRAFEIPFLQLELSVHYFCPWGSLFVSTRDQKKTSCIIWVWYRLLQKKTKLTWLLGRGGSRPGRPSGSNGPAYLKLGLV